ncbi:nucleoside 2-deoxyribosyltransferase [Nocardioides sp. cx-173]|uniref:nucleoside 2-deoxyribosyltransferase n=1 Tax=Nocardioides sp. cx-173 TaxID=2898796 RepID=UPI001E510CD3|nr:nucleoside 2-deoxyribosyltransferase [Nocardioides sp. cx-173]MCD4527225.1 nucleoside 2-deoxyribosyltransferase [Nocardioides sp. cx-173]UGB40418.1 nucleoside 2-deoxyribosyltransferase [Nocardioides sp. cx-173]
MTQDEDPWAAPPQKHQVFFISPIGEDGSEARKAADQTLRHLVRKALPEAQYTVERADEDKHPGAITPRILGKIIDADVVLADLSGFNPNVFYELAVAHGHHKPVVHMQRSDERPAFDVKDMRIVRYQLSDPDKLEAAVTELRGQTSLALSSSDVIETPLTATGKFQALDQSADPQAEVAERLAAIEQRLTPQRSAPASRVRSVDDTFAVARWVEAQLKEKAFTREDIATLKSADTSAWFDDWVDGLVERFATEESDPWKSPAPSAGAPAGTDPWDAPGVGTEEPPF